MKFIHLGDLHLGKSLGDFDLKEDQKYILDQILDMIQKEGADSIFIAGDVYDKAIPSEAATRLLDYLLRELAGRGIRTFMISGNHDSDDRLNFGSDLFTENKIYISAVFDGTLHKQTVKDEFGEVDVYMMPFVKASQVRHFYPEDDINNYEDAVRAIIRHADIDTSRRNVLLAHQFVSGTSQDPELSGSEGIGTQMVGLVEKISYDCFDDFDYVALGHIHAPQSVGRDEVRYCGSPLKYSLKEADRRDKTVPIITMKEKGDIKIELAPLVPMRDLVHIRGKFSELLQEEHRVNPKDYVYLTLTEDDYVDNAMGIFKQIYPYIVKINYDNSYSQDVEYVDISELAEKTSFDELIQGFYHQIYGCEISEEEMELMKAVAQEAGVIDETN